MRLDYELKIEQGQADHYTGVKAGVNILQYSAMELQDFIRRTLSNQVEIGDSDMDGEEEPSEKLPEDDFPWEGYFQDMDLDMAGYMPNPQAGIGRVPTVDNYAGSPSNDGRTAWAVAFNESFAAAIGIAAYLIGDLDRTAICAAIWTNLPMLSGAGRRWKWDSGSCRNCNHRESPAISGNACCGFRPWIIPSAGGQDC